MKQAGRRLGSLASMSLCKYRSSAHLLKLTRTSENLTPNLQLSSFNTVGLISPSWSSWFVAVIVETHPIHADVSRVGFSGSRIEWRYFQLDQIQQQVCRRKQAGRRLGSLASMSLCKYRTSAHLLKLTRTSIKLTGKLDCDVARLVSIMIISDDPDRLSVRTIQIHHIGKYCVKVSSNSDKNCRRRSILKK